MHRAACERYFRRWNHRVSGLEWMVTFVRADTRLLEIAARPWLAESLEPR